MVKHLADDSAFLANLKDGKGWEELMARTFQDLGFAAVATPLRIRENKAQRRAYADACDLIVKTTGPGWVWRFEVKSRELEFGDSPESYPHEWAFVMNVRPWLRKKRKPHATILVSRQTGSALVVPTSTEEKWRQRKIENRVQDVEQLIFECPRGLLRPFPDLVKWMGPPAGKKAQVANG